MEQKHILLSAISVGVGVGLGLASDQAVSKWTGFSSLAEGITPQKIEMELKRLILDGRDINLTFDDFPYFLSERTRVLLTSAAYVHLNDSDVSKHTRNLSPASRAILLSGPTELYQKSLAKALAHYFGAKLLLLDMNDFSRKLQSKYGNSNGESSSKRSISESTLDRVSSFFGNLSIIPTRDDNGGMLFRQRSGFDKKSRGMEGRNCSLTHSRNGSVSSDMSSISSQSSSYSAPMRENTSWSFDEKVLLQTLYKVINSYSENGGLILYVRDVDRVILPSTRLYKLFERVLKKLSGSVLVLGSRILDSDYVNDEAEEKLKLLFPYTIEVQPPEDENRLINWNEQLEEDMKFIKFHENKNHIAKVLAANDLECDDLCSLCQADSMVVSNYIEEIVISAISYHLMNNSNPEYRNGKLRISSNSLSRGLSIFQEGNSCNDKMEKNADAPKGRESKADNLRAENKNDAEKSTSSNPSSTKPEARPDTEFEKRIRPEVIPANEIGVTFEDIGALDETKESLQELVMLPLRRPDLFNGGLLKPCRGILLFGPPGTGKTMLAKAIANEAGASFINVSMSTITSKWFGEDEKNVRALFTLAAKVSPTIIFLDEVDSMLGQRTRVGEHEAMRKIKNEFMTHWDGLLTKPSERILVLAATNRPFDLDEAIIRRFERRIMVGLPSAENREMILRTLLAKECVKDIDLKELATMTEGYSGSDLKNLCTTAAYRPVRELMQQERQHDKEQKKQVEGEKNSEDSSMKNVEERKNSEDCSEADGKSKEERIITLRPLCMEDMRQAKNQVAASFASEGSIMNELKQWNELYGEGGSRKKQQLTYFL